VHHDSVKTFKEKGRIPQKLQIRDQPLVVNKNQPEFKLKWSKTLRDCKNRLIDLLVEHLDNTIKKTKANIRSESTDCLESLK